MNNAFEQQLIGYEQFEKSVYLPAEFVFERTKRFQVLSTTSGFLFAYPELHRGYACGLDKQYAAMVDIRTNSSHQAVIANRHVISPSASQDQQIGSIVHDGTHAEFQNREGTAIAAADELRISYGENEFTVDEKTIAAILKIPLKDLNGQRKLTANVQRIHSTALLAVASYWMTE